MEFVRELFDTLRQLNPERLGEFFAYAGNWLYAVLFLIIFVETGLVVAPFLPGDSLLFTVGAVAAGSQLHLGVVIVLLTLAAILGDAVNYAIGRRVGPKVFTREDSWLLNKKHLLEAQHFYERHGGKTIFLARFMPFIRTFAPFVAGVGRMSYVRFATFNVTGGITWVVSLTCLGYWFGKIPVVERNFEYVILAIIVISVLPPFIHWAQGRLRARRQPAGVGSPDV